MGALAGALLLWLLDRAVGWGTPAGAAVTGAAAGLGLAAGIGLWRSDWFGVQGTEENDLGIQPADYVMKLREEQLKVTKHKVQLADVTMHREYVEEERTLTVPVIREELVVDKDGREIARIPVREEQVEVRKVPVELSDVRIYTDKLDRVVTVEDTLLKETARVEVNGEADLVGEQHPN